MWERGAGRRREVKEWTESLTLIFSSEDFMSARKLGCLNSQVWLQCERKFSSRPLGAPPRTA